MFHGPSAFLGLGQNLALTGATGLLEEFSAFISGQTGPHTIEKLLGILPPRHSPDDKRLKKLVPALRGYTWSSCRGPV